MLKLILVCVVLELYKNQCGSESWNNKFDSNIIILCICVVKKKKDKLFDQKWENEIKEILHDKKY